MKAKTRCITVFCAVLLAFIVFADYSYACSCMTGKETVDKEFSDTPNVLILTLQNVELLPEKTAGGGDIWQVTFAVEKVFKGNLKVSDKISLKKEFFPCGWNFFEEDVGKKYLFYIKNQDKENNWNLPFCNSRSSRLNYAADLLYLENLENVRNKTCLSGSFEQFFEEMNESGKNFKLNHLAGKKVRISGNGKNLELITDKNGVYEIYDLPPGKYKLTPEKINGYKFTNDGGNSVEVEIKAKSHTEENISYFIHNAIRGKLYDSDGKALREVGIGLIPANEDLPQWYFSEKQTDKNGNFEFESIPIGKYLIVVNKDGEINSGEPFGTFYYPGTEDRKEASEINIGAGVFYENFVIKAPKTEEVITVSGILVYEDGQPATGETIGFLEENKDSENIYKDGESAQTDENGRFTIKIIKGQSGNLFGEFYTYEGEFTNCPQIEKLLDKSRGTTIIKTSPKKINAVENLSGIELKFPFNNCKKKD